MNSKGTNYGRNKRALCHLTGFSTHLDLRGLQELGLICKRQLEEPCCPSLWCCCPPAGHRGGDARLWGGAISYFPSSGWNGRGSQLAGDSRVLRQARGGGCSTCTPPTLGHFKSCYVSSVLLLDCSKPTSFSSSDKTSTGKASKDICTPPCPGERASLDRWDYRLPLRQHPSARRLLYC